MSLRVLELDGTIYDKPEIAIERIQAFEPMALQNNPAGYYVCISGGKDSSVIQDLCIKAGVKCEFVHSFTSVDYPETIKFLKSEEKRLTEQGHIFRFEYPVTKEGKRKTMWNLIPKNGLPTRIIRWCCSELKEFGGRKRYCITGVRWAESAKRKKRTVHERQSKTDDRILLNNDNDMRRRLSEMCLTQHKFILNPIIDWENTDVWDYIKENNLPYNPLYDKGFKRVGCIGCPMTGKRKEEFVRNPKYMRAYFRAVVKHLEYRKERGLKLDYVMETPEKYFDWWID